MISRVNSIGFKGAQTQASNASQDIVSKAKAYNAQLKDTLNSNPEKKAKANIALSGVTIAGILTMLLGSKKAIPKYLGALAATLSSVAALNLNWFSEKKETASPVIELSKAQQAPVEEAKAPEEIQASAEEQVQQAALTPVKEESQLPSQIQQMLAQSGQSQA